MFTFLSAVAECQSTSPTYRPLVARPSQREPCVNVTGVTRIWQNFKYIHGFRERQSITPNKRLFESIFNNFLTLIKQTLPIN